MGFAKKFGSKGFTAQRLTRIREIERAHMQETGFNSIENNAGHVFRAAKALYADAKENQATYIFLGQGMRPLFETVRGLNEIMGGFPRGKFRYFITPEKLLSVPHDFVQELRQSGIIKGRRFVVVDYRHDGETFRRMKAAINEISVTAEVLLMDQRHLIGIGHADMLPKPTLKSIAGNLRAKPSSEQRDKFLLAQYYLQQMLQEEMKRTGSGAAAARKPK